MYFQNKSLFLPQNSFNLIIINIWSVPLRYSGGGGLRRCNGGGKRPGERRLGDFIGDLPAEWRFGDLMGDLPTEWRFGDR